MTPLRKDEKLRRQKGLRLWISELNSQFDITIFNTKLEWKI